MNKLVTVNVNTQSKENGRRELRTGVPPRSAGVSPGSEHSRRMTMELCRTEKRQKKGFPNEGFDSEVGKHSEADLRLELLI